MHFIWGRYFCNNTIHRDPFDLLPASTDVARELYSFWLYSIYFVIDLVEFM